MRVRAALFTVLCLAAATLAGLAHAEGPDGTGAAAAGRAWSGPYGSPLDRIGVGVHPRWGTASDYDLTFLHPEWWSDWGTSAEPPVPGMDYAQLILVRQAVWPPDWNIIQRRVQLNPGALWLIGNEPEGPYNQGNRTPAEYAQIYHEAYARIKGWDPTAQIAVGGVIQPTPLRLLWLDQVLQEYQQRYGTSLPVDVWNVHVQILNEQRGGWGAGIPAGLNYNAGFVIGIDEFYKNASPDLFKQFVTAFRAWMRERGYRDTPLIISEYGVLLPSSYLEMDDPDHRGGDQMVCDFMRETFRWMLDEAVDPGSGFPADGNRLVQRWLWYSLNDQPFNFDTYEGFNGGLYDYRNPKHLTQFGACFRDFVTGRGVSYADLAVRSLRFNRETLPAGTPTTVRISAIVANRGERAAGPVSLRLSLGRPGDGGKLLAEGKLAGSFSRYGQSGVYQYTWNNVTRPEGSQTEVCLQLDPANAIPEADEDNNLFCRSLVVPYRLFVPVVASTAVKAAN
ncbi:MAG: hypothetical protein M5U01_07700 [Ardenticatenaceae bacterium]|nr:hypothetical protein [Ardenticatenaceae bacterium]